MQKSRLDSAKNPEKVDDDALCSICYDLPFQPVRCLGPCKCICCRKCAALCSHNGDNPVCCPNKCSEPWRYTLAVLAPIEMTCPYGNDCVIPSMDQFQKHRQSCPKLPPHLRDEYLRKRNFLCPNDHELRFFVGTEAEMLGTICSGCGEKQVIRSECLPCQKRFCIQCRMPPCTKQSCPIDHSFTLVKPASVCYICDLCNIAPSLAEVGIYDDPVCNFTVCEVCYEQLPESFTPENKVLHEKLALRNRNTCAKGHQLERLIPSVVSHCSSCNVEKSCWKACRECACSYCMGCVELFIDHRGCCEFGHLLTSHTIEQKCMQCQSNNGQRVDFDCGVVTCEACYKRHICKEGSKRRLKTTVKCDQGHVLEFLHNEETELSCEKCGKEGILKLVCVQCISRKHYCSACIGYDLKDSCYFGDSWTKMQGSSICTECGLVKESLWSCEHCKIRICLECRQNMPP